MDDMEKRIQSEDQSLTRLQRGMVVQLFNAEHVVASVNSCRARCLPLAKKSVDYNTRFGKKVAFETCGTAQNISPESEIEILQRLTETQMLAMNIPAVESNKIL